MGFSSFNRIKRKRQYDPGPNSVNIIGSNPILGIEKKFDMPGFQRILSHDPDLVAAMDELVPTAFHSLAAPLQVVWSGIKAVIDHKEGKIPDEANFSGKPPKRKRTAEKETSNKRSKRSPPRPNPSDREVSDGKDNLCSESDSE